MTDNYWASTVQFLTVQTGHRFPKQEAIIGKKTQDPEQLRTVSSNILQRDVDTGDEARLEAAEMWFLQRMLRIPWTDRETNSNVLNRADIERHLLKTNRSKQAEFWGHVIIKSKLENLVMTCKFDGTKGPGRPRTSIA